MNDAFCPSCNCERCKRRGACSPCGDICARCYRRNCMCGGLDCCMPPAHPGGGPANLSGGYLLPKILSSGHECVRRMEAAIAVSGLPCAVPQPLQICQICAAGEAPKWREDDLYGNQNRAIVLLVEIPLDVTLRDACGGMHQGRGSIFMRVRVPLACPREDCWRNQWMMVPAVRLLGCEGAGCDGVFCVRLEANLDAYLVRSEPVCRQENRPACPPPLPLYPPPCRIGGHCCT